jgi:hypothetical protein
MKRSLWLFCGAMALCGASQAASKTDILRGGLGFLFPDHNSFSNPGQFSISHGMAMEADYSREDSTQLQNLTPSLVYGNGKVGLGAFGSRTGTNLTAKNGSLDVIGAGAGVALAKERLTLGVGYDRVISSSPQNDGNLRVEATLNGPQRKGPAFGVEATTTLGSTHIAGVTAAAGYSFRSNVSIEAVFKNYDTRQFKNSTLSGFVNWADNMFYLGAGYTYLNLNSLNEIEGRLGVMLGRFVDVSVFAAKVFKGELSYGGSLRASF